MVFIFRFAIPKKFNSQYKPLCNPGALGTLGRVKIMSSARLEEAIRGVLRRNVALGRAEKFVTDHEFLNRSRAQERRKVVRMQVPLFIASPVGRLLVESHGIGERGLKQVVVTNGDAAHDAAQEASLFPAELVDRSDMG